MLSIPAKIKFPYFLYTYAHVIVNLRDIIRLFLFSLIYHNPPKRKHNINSNPSLPLRISIITQLPYIKFKKMSSDSSSHVSVVSNYVSLLLLM